MGSSRISNALLSLAGGLDVLAQGAYRREEKESERAWQQQVMDSQNAFAQRMQELRQQHDTSMMDKQQVFAAGEADKRRSFEGEMFDKEQSARMQMFQMEQGAVNARHAASLGAEWARIKQAAAQVEDAKEDRQLQRQLKVYEVQVAQGQSQYNSVLEAMQKEMAELGKNAALQYDKTGRKEAEAKKIEERYAPTLKQAQDAMTSAMSSYSQAVGIKADFSKVQGSVSSSAGVEPSGMRDKVSAAVEAAKAQIGGGPMPPEQNLISGFMKQGLSRTEALAAARQMRSSGAR